jgi:hypothetical protein
MKDRFIKAGIKERILFRALTGIQKQITVDKYTKADGYEHYDLYFSSGHTIQNKPLEIKVRNYNMNDYGEEGWVIELDKYNKLIELDPQAFYCCFFKDGILFWDLSKITPEIEYNEYNRTTMNKSNGTRTKANIKLKNKQAVSQYFINIPDITKTVDSYFNKKYNVK